MDPRDATLLRLADPSARLELLGSELRLALLHDHVTQAPEDVELEVTDVELTPALDTNLWLDARVEASLTWTDEQDAPGQLQVTLACVILEDTTSWRDALRHAALARNHIPEHAYLVWLIPAARFDDEGWPGAGDLRTNSRSKRLEARLSRAAPWLLDARRILLLPLHETP